jgi:transposase
LAREAQQKEAAVSNARTIGLDLAKHVFQAHGADEAGEVAFRKRLRRDKVLEFFASQPRCLVDMEACGGAHHWAREISKLGHEVRLIPASYVKPFVKCQKNDMADAEAICEAAQRPTMRFVAVKSEKQQASAVVFRARDILVRQRIQLINALRGHLAEYGMVVAQGPSQVARLISHVEDPTTGLPDAARLTLGILIETLKSLDDRIRRLDAEIARRAKEDEVARRLTTVPGIGPVTATALAALAPAAETFRKGRDFAAWMGLTPLQRSTGGKQKLGHTSKMGERTLRRLLIIGASSVVQQATRRGAPAGTWLAQMLSRKPRMLVVVALTNKMARTVCALLAKGETYRSPAVAASS